MTILMYVYLELLKVNYPLKVISHNLKVSQHVGPFSGLIRLSVCKTIVACVSLSTARNAHGARSRHTHAHTRMYLQCDDLSERRADRVQTLESARVRIRVSW